MKKIRKTNPPIELLEWIQVQQENDLEVNYSVLQGKPAHIALKAKLLKEQGYLCAYTGLKISTKTSHIEHLKPQNPEDPEIERVYLEDVYYRNVVACFPKDEKDTSTGFGATYKGNWWSKEEFVSPCQEDCERRFSFNWNGKVSPTFAGDNAAIKTIQILGLNKDPNSNQYSQNGTYHIQDRRHNAIKAFFGFSKNPKIKPLNQAEAKILLRTIGIPDPSGHLKEFCFVFEQLLPKFIT